MYSSSFRLSAAPMLPLQPRQAAGHVIEDALLGFESRHPRLRVGAVTVAEQRSNTTRGLISGGSGLAGPRQDMDMYAQV
jgi:hypothetical protein